MINSLDPKNPMVSPHAAMANLWGKSHFQTAALDHTLNLHHQPGALMPTLGTRMGAATPVLRAALPTGARTGVLERNLQRFVLRK